LRRKFSSYRSFSHLGYPVRANLLASRLASNRRNSSLNSSSLPAFCIFARAAGPSYLQMTKVVYLQVILPPSLPARSPSAKVYSSILLLLPLYILEFNIYISSGILLLQAYFSRALEVILNLICYIYFIVYILLFPGYLIAYSYIKNSFRIFISVKNNLLIYPPTLFDHRNCVQLHFVKK